MRARLNRNPNNENKNRDDEGRQNTVQEPNKTTENIMASKTELVIQIIFAAAMVATSFLSFYTIHIAALILIFKAV